MASDVDETQQEQKQSQTSIRENINDKEFIWNIIKTSSCIMFGSINVANCIYKTFKDNSWFKMDDILNNLIEFKENNIISIIENNMKNNNKIGRKWTDNNNTILYQLLLTIYKDKKTNISNILKAFTTILPQENTTNTFTQCNPQQIVQILINETFNILSTEINVKFHNKIIEFFIEKQISADTFDTINTQRKDDFVDDLSLYVGNTVKKFKDALSKLYKTIAGYKDNAIVRCAICYYTNNISPKTKIKICVGCNSEIKSDEEKEIKSDDTAVTRVADKIKEIMKFVNARSGMNFDKEVFPSLMKLIGNHKNVLYEMRYYNYGVELHEKDYDTVLKSFIGWVFTVKCDNEECNDALKVNCGCDHNSFQLYTYRIILALIGLKSGVEYSLLKQLSVTNRTVKDIWQIFKDILPEKLTAKTKESTTKPYINEYKRYIIEWICFELYNFKCNVCGHINKSILINRMFDYSVNLKHCRLCHNPRLKGDKNVANLATAVRKKQIQDVVYPTRQQNSTFCIKYECGIPIRYVVLKPKYKSLAEELLLNDIKSISKDLWGKYLHDAIALHHKLKNNLAIAAFSTELDRDYGISNNEMIDVCHLIVILIYTKEVVFARRFNELYWQWKNINLFCNSAYWYGRNLFEAVYFFGEQFDHDRFKIQPLRHGLASPMEFDSFAPTIHCPASTNDRNETAIQKAKINGCVLTYAPKYTGKIEKTKCISTPQWSGYDNHEWLFMGSSKLQICCITMNKQNFMSYNYAMLYLEKIFSQTIYDHNYYNTM
eukprot:469345_1